MGGRSRQWNARLTSAINRTSVMRPRGRSGGPVSAYVFSRRLRVMGLRGFVAGVAAIALVLAGFGAVVPDRVDQLAPSLGPLAHEAHDHLPAAFGGPAASATAPAIGGAAPQRPPVSVMVAAIVRKDMPWRVEEIGVAQSMATVALRPHFDATV